MAVHNLRPETELLLMRLGLDASHMGYICLARAIDIVRSDVLMRAALYNEVYPAISQETGLTVAGVEVSIRREVKKLNSARREFMATDLLKNGGPDKPGAARVIAAFAAYLGPLP